MTQEVLKSIKFGIAQDIEEGKNQLTAEVAIRLNFDYVVADTSPEDIEEIKTLMMYQTIDNLINLGIKLNEEREDARESNAGEQTGIREDTRPS